MRVPGWQRKLNEYMLEAQERYRKHGFGYGTFDCCVFVADWIEICTGEDPLLDYRDLYTTKDEALALLKEREGTLYHALISRFGTPVHPAKAQRGDIAYRRKEQALGIYCTAGAQMRALFLADDGFAFYRAKDMTHAFRVG